MIKMVISPEYFGKNDKKSDIIAQIKKTGASNVNVDELTGFVTAVMSFENYEKFVNSLKARIAETCEQIKDRFDKIDRIESNPDYTVFKVHGGTIEKKDRKAISLDILMSSATYQVISGIPQCDAAVKVYFFDDDECLVDCVNMKEGAF